MYNSLINFHTHLPLENAKYDDLSIYSLDLAKNEAPELIPEDLYLSVGLHPWSLQAPEHHLPDMDRLKHYACMPQTLMIGESGLDKTSKGAQWQWQVLSLEKHAQLAQQVNKPLLCHCVRSYDEMLLLLKKLKLSVPIVFHDFNGHSHQAKQLLKFDSYFSFGPSLFFPKSKAQDSIALIPQDRLLLENDMGERDLYDVYFKASELRNTQVEDLSIQMMINFHYLFAL